MKSLEKLIKYALNTKGEYERQMQAVEDLLRTVKKSLVVTRLLDIGCGEGRRTLRYANYLGVTPDNIRGVDISEELITDSRKHFRVERVDIEVDLLPFPDEFFDLVILNQVLEHLKNIRWVMQETDRVLKKGAYCLIGVPNLAALHNRILLLFGAQPVCMHVMGPHIRGFTHLAMIDFLKTNSHFRIVKHTGSSLYPLPPPLSEVLARRLTSLSVYPFYLIRKI